MHDKHCVPCTNFAPRLDEKRIAEYLKEFSNWEYVPNPDRIIRTIRVIHFQAAIDLLNKIGEIAEQEQHHPNVSIHDYRFMTIEMYTHKINGLHENDFIIAKKIDFLVLNNKHLLKKD